MKKHVLVTLLMAALLVSGLQMASAKTIYVNQAGTNGAKTTIADAMALAVSGDQVVITDSGTYAEAPVTLDGVTLRGAVNSPKAVFSPNAGFSIRLKGGGAVENLELKFNGGWGPGFYITGPFKISRVVVSAKNGGDTAAFWFACSAAEVVQGTMEYVTAYGFNASAGLIKFGSDWDVDGTVANVGPIVINHCTLLYNVGYLAMIAPGGWPTECAEVEIKNSILGCYNTDGPQISGIFVNDNTRHNPPAFNHHHNLYTNIWMMEMYWYSPVEILDDPDTPANEGHAAGYLETGIYPSAAKGELGAQWLASDPFNNGKAGAWDLKLKANTAVCLWKGDDGLHMGSDVNTVPVELSTFEIQ